MNKRLLNLFVICTCYLFLSLPAGASVNNGSFNNFGTVFDNQGNGNISHYFISWVENISNESDFSDYHFITICVLDPKLAEIKSEVWKKICQERSRLRIKYPEPDPSDDGSCFLAWQHMMEKKERKLDRLYERYFSIKGRTEVYLVEGDYQQGQILEYLPSQAIKASKRPTVEKIGKVLVIEM